MTQHVGKSPTRKPEDPHILEKESAEWKRHLYFRDILIGDTEIAQEYNRIKKTLSEKYGFDREKYQEEKSKFIRAIINGNRDETRAGGHDVS